MSLLLTLAFAAAVSGAPPQLDAVPQTRLDPTLRCRLGAYALPDGRVVTITGQGGHPRNLQYTLSAGAFAGCRKARTGPMPAGA